MPNKIHFTLFFLLVTALLFVSCQEKKELNNFQEPFAIQGYAIPPILSVQSHRPVLFTARVTHPEGSAGISRVELIWQDSTGAASLDKQMLDDGGALDASSGDVVAYDQVYSWAVAPADLGLPLGRYSVFIRAVDRAGEVREGTAETVDLVFNTAPRILDVVFPDSIPLGMEPRQAGITVADSEGIDDVRWVILKGIPRAGQTPIFQDTILPQGNHSPVFLKTVDSSFAAAKTGEYLLKIFAEDRVGDTSRAVTRTLVTQNTPPEIFNAQLPDTLNLPPQGYQVVTKVTVQVKDRQSLADIDKVYFDSIKPDGTPSSFNPFLMYDNGLPYDPNNSVAVDDSIAGDGEYTITIFLPSGTTPGSYKFLFYAQDKVGHLTAGPVDSIQVVSAK